MCFEVSNEVLSKHKIDGETGIDFYCINCSLGKERGDS